VIEDPQNFLRPVAVELRAPRRGEAHRLARGGMFFRGGGVALWERFGRFGGKSPLPVGGFGNWWNRVLRPFLRKFHIRRNPFPGGIG